MENGLVNIINNTYDHFSHAICCVTHSGPSASKLETEIDIKEINKGKGNDFKLIWRMAQQIKSINPDIVHTRTWGATDGIIAAALARTPIIVHSEHGWTSDDQYGLNRKRQIARRILCGFLATHCLTVSPQLTNWLIHKVKINKKKISTIINGVDTEKYRPTSDKKFKVSLGLHPDTILIGTVGRLDPIKNHKLLINAFEALPHANKSSLVIIGNGVEYSHLKQLIEASAYKEKIFLLGEKNEIEKIVPAFDILVSSSFNEGISNTILEALSCGVPIIASKVGGNVELVENMETGILFTSNIQTELVEAIRFYIENPETRIKHGKNARGNALRKFSLKRMITEYTGLYNRLYHQRTHR